MPGQHQSEIAGQHQGNAQGQHTGPCCCTGQGDFCCGHCSNLPLIYHIVCDQGGFAGVNEALHLTGSGWASANTPWGVWYIALDCVAIYPLIQVWLQNTGPPGSSWIGAGLASCCQNAGGIYTRQSSPFEQLYMSS